MGHVIWTDPALDDLKRTGEYIAQHSPTYAVRVMERTLEATRRLELFPRISQVVPEFGQEDLREILCAPYRILYRVCPGACYILGIVHGRRDLVTAFDPHDE